MIVKGGCVSSGFFNSRGKYMNKAILILALAALTVANGFAATKTVKKSVAKSVTNTESKTEFGVDAGMALPLGPNHFTDNYSAGYGGGIFGRYKLCTKTSIGLAASFYSYGTKTNLGADAPAFTSVEILMQSKMKFGKGSVKPYLLVGLGMDLGVVGHQTNAYGYTPTGKAVTNSDFMLQPGFGVEFGRSTKIFVEVKLSVVMCTDDHTTYLPINIGVQF
jgi:hypothetical protein